MRLRVLSIIIFSLFLIPSISVSESKRGDNVVLNAMEQELNRSWKKLRLDGYEAPYFISYQIKDNAFYIIKGKYGAVIELGNDRTRRLFVDVRVGDYEFDNSILGKSGGSAASFDSSIIPLDNDIDSIRAVLWQATDAAYKDALTQYFNKKAENVGEVKDEEIPSFSREEAHIYNEPEIELVFNPKDWGMKIREVSSVFKEYKDLIDASVSITAQKETVYFVNSEGSRYIRDEILYSIDADAMTRADDGRLIKHYENLYYFAPQDIPSVDKLRSVMRDLVKETLDMKGAEVLSPVNVPAILEPEAAGIVFHEAVGHRLEGERQINDKEGRTFKDRLGEKIIPTFLSIIDDPELKSFNGIHLLGYYPVDDEGVPGQSVVLVENGILRNFLLSRTPINGFKRSNGHGRAAYRRAPMARMSNTIVKSKKEYPKQELKSLLIEEVKRQEKPFGLIIKKMTGGETNTSTYDFQAFRATPLVVHKVDPETGKETPVRDVEIVGTPLVSINKIFATGDDYEVFNGFCGAESGYVPVSTVAPSILVSEIELQRQSSKKEKLPLLPPPFFDGDADRSAIKPDQVETD
ncbi:MAG: TldD/PmbA family protein [Deltaproteobacteria bacterium]|nr:TldD/PmbA family protein [Deltaproteobacteria bacterium]